MGGSTKAPAKAAATSWLQDRVTGGGQAKAAAQAARAPQPAAGSRRRTGYTRVLIHLLVLASLGVASSEPLRAALLYGFSFSLALFLSAVSVALPELTRPADRAPRTRRAPRAPRAPPGGRGRVDDRRVREVGSAPARGPSRLLHRAGRTQRTHPRYTRRCGARHGAGENARRFGRFRVV